MLILLDIELHTFGSLKEKLDLNNSEFDIGKIQLSYDESRVSYDCLLLVQMWTH